MLNYEYLKNRPKEFLAVTGLTLTEFVGLLGVFEAQYEQAYPKERCMDGQVRQRRAGAGRKAKLASGEDKLLFILAYQKVYTLQTFHALQFGMSQGRANEWIHRLSGVLQATLEQLGMRPIRAGAAVENSLLAQAGGTDLVIDGTERRRQRPQNPTAQREHYSGKKSPHR